MFLYNFVFYTIFRFYRNRSCKYEDLNYSFFQCRKMSRQLLVIMELRCSEDYGLFISQGVIEAYLKLFMDIARQRSDINDLDFTDYEVMKTKLIL